MFEEHKDKFLFLFIMQRTQSSVSFLYNNKSIQWHLIMYLNFGRLLVIRVYQMLVRSEFKIIINFRIFKISKIYWNLTIIISVILIEIKLLFFCNLFNNTTVFYEYRKEMKDDKMMKKPISVTSTSRY